MRLLVTGAGGLIGSNLAASAAQQSWSVLGTWRGTPVSVLGARTAQLDVADRHACVTLAEEFEPDVIVHAAAESSPGCLEREPHLAELNLLGAENTLAAARAVRARYVLVSCDLVFSGMRPSAECWEEEDPAQPINALGRSLLACERLAQQFGGSWTITRPADVYGVNLSIPAAPPPAASASGGREQAGAVGGLGPAANGNGAGWAALAARARHVWERSGAPLRWVAWLRAGKPLAAPPGIRRSPTYAWDYAQCVCELIAQECEGTYNMAGPTILGRLAHLRLVARAFNCDVRLVQEGSPAAFLRASEGAPDGIEATPAAPVPMPANTALCDRKASFVLGRAAVDPFTGHRLMRRQLDQVLNPPTPPTCADPHSPPLAPPVAPIPPIPPISVQALG
ncbi:MAG: sugar nucleotide-binding protein [Solirubrobacteraceae bacterium]